MSTLSSVGSTTPATTSSTSSSLATSGSGSVSANSGSGTISVGGLISGLNTSQLITGLLAVQQAQITQVTNQQTAIQNKEVAYQALQAQLVSFQTDVNQLAQTSNGPFDGRTATSSSTSVATAAATSSAVAGTYSLTVNSIASADEIASQNFASQTSQITQGTLVVGSGSKSATITIGSTNNTLQGLASAINNAAVGVSATVINDGTATPYRLLLTANNTGISNAVTLDTTGLAAATSLSTAVKPTFGVGAAVATSGTPNVTSGGAYTGTANATYTFTIGTPTLGSGDLSSASPTTVPVTYTDGTHTGSFNLTNADLNSPVSVGTTGIQLTFGSGALSAGQTFTVAGTLVQPPTDASLTLGSGSGAVTVTSASNTVDNVINGVAVNLVSQSPSTPIQITVANDTTTATTAIQNFVTAYNSVMSTIATDIAYDPSTSTAGPLLGDSSILQIENKLSSQVTGVVAGTNSKLNSLSALGITANASGQLAVDSTQLSNVLSGKVSGVTLNDVRNLFALGGQSTNTGVTYLNATSATQSSTTGYGVVVTQAAHQAVLTGSALTYPVTTSPFTLTVNGLTSGTITLPAATYASGPALVTALQTQIDADKTIGGLVNVGLTAGNQLTFTTDSYGQAATLSLAATSFLGFGSAATAAGQDVAGSYLVNGVAEAATGSGQTLTGNSGNANTDSLATLITLGDSQVSSTPTTPVATVTVTRGLAAQLGDSLNNLLDPTTGTLQTIDANFQAQIAAYQTSINQLNAQYTAKQTDLETQFNNLEVTLNNLKTAGNYLSSQTTASNTLSTSLASQGTGS